MMTTLEKILQDIEECRIIASLDGNFNSSASFEKCEEIIKKRLSCENHTETARQSRDNGWIPCSERMPEEKKSVLIQWEKYDRHLGVTLTYLDVMWLEDKEEQIFETINGVPNGKVIAWRPLPDPYKPPVESAEEKSMREREEFFNGGE